MSVNNLSSSIRSIEPSQPDIRTLTDKTECAFRASVVSSGQIAAMTAAPTFFIGLHIVCTSSGGRFDMSTPFGLLLMGASPVIRLAQLVFGIPSLLIASTATVAIGAIHGSALASSKLKDCLKSSMTQGETLAQSFVERIGKAVKSLPPEGQSFFQVHPYHLISLGVLQVAFLNNAHVSPADKLEIATKGEDRIYLERDDLMNARHKEYFDQVKVIERTIDQIHFYSSKKEERWLELGRGLISVDPSLKEQYGQGKEDKNRPHYVKLVEQLTALSCQVVEDPNFLYAWNKKFPDTPIAASHAMSSN